MKSVCIITATRAEYGVLKRILSLLYEQKELQVLLYVTGAHLSEQYGRTIEEIREDGFFINREIDINIVGVDVIDVADSIAIAQSSFTRVFEQDKPDMIVVVGDRYELLPICTSALLLGIPIAHISGGEVTSGAIDDTVRHCITKMSYLHFPACSEYRKRVIQLGEAPERVYDFGDVGMDTILNTDYLSKEELEKSLSINLDRSYALVTFHPVTREFDCGVSQLEEMLKAVKRENKYIYIITKSNADNGGKSINNRLELFCERNANCYLFDSLGSRKYLSLLKDCSFLLGNSSSAIYEAPAFRVASINIGNRQSGRIKADSVIDCEPVEQEIFSAMQKINSEDFKESLKTMEIPFKGNLVAENIVDTIKKVVLNGNINLQKGFYDIQ